MRIEKLNRSNEYVLVFLLILLLISCFSKINWFLVYLFIFLVLIQLYYTITGITKLELDTRNLKIYFLFYTKVFDVKEISYENKVKFTYRMGSGLEYMNLYHDKILIARVDITKKNKENLTRIMEIIDSGSV